VIECEANGGIAAVFVINIHKFAAVSDRFGYQTGDRLLQLLTLRLGECVRGGDTVARLGFDRFALLLAGIDTGLSATDAATRIIAAVSQPFIIDEQTHYVTLSIGLSLAPYDSRDETAVLHAADTAMRAARAAGANGFLWYHPDMSVDSTKDARCSNELRSALKNTEFELHYQPIVDIERDRVVAVESLVRWNHPTRGLVGPGEFIALADRTGLIIPLGEWVLREACRQAREWQDQGRTLRVCVNVSAVQFRLPNFVSLVASILTEHELAPDRLELELTESVMVDGFGDMIEKLGQLKSMGLRLSIDDFGTGYSSLAYLKYFPVDTLKIDRAFITDITTDTYDRAIAKSVLTLANDLGLECIAEGVENADQLETLRAIGSTLIQGYYFCKPMKPEKLSALLSGSVAAMLH
jgi:diguanylate cyclase (GGDEF)-like protein